MTISLPGSSGKGLSGLFKRKKIEKAVKPTSKRQLDGNQVAKLFDKTARTAKPIKPAKLSETEMNARTQQTNLRGALYSND